jgi:hypothetical protein
MTTKPTPSTGPQQASASFQVTSWDEKPYETLASGGKLTRASVTGRFTGELEGDAAIEFLMAYSDDEHAEFVGVQQLTGRVGERSGDFVVRATGTFQDGVARADWTVVPGTASGELTGLTGDGEFVASSTEASGKLTYTIEAG